jgi:hypothetical protein
MTNLAELKASSPAYAKMSDMEFASKVYRTHYADKMSFPEFAKRTGFDPYGDANGHDPTQGMSGGDKFLAGMGKSFMDTGRGVQQLLGARSAAEADATAKEDAPLMQGAGLAGNVVGQIAQMAVPVGGEAKAASLLGRAAPLVAGAAKAAAFQGIQPLQTGQNRAVEVTKAAGLGAGGAVLGQAGQVAKAGLISRMDPVAQRLAQKASDMGMKLGVGQLSDNPIVRTVASQLDRLPFSGATARSRANQEILNGAVGDTFGANAPKITPDVFAAAKDRLSQGFETLTNRNNLKLDPQSVSRINQIMDEAERLSGSGKIVKGWVQELLSKAESSGEIPGKAYQSVDSRIGKAMKQGGEASHYLGELRDAVRSAMDNSISASDRKAWQALRQRWASLKTVEPLAAKSPTGDVSAAGLMGRVTADKAGKARMAVGNGGKLGELARIGQRFLKDAPNSGTADRLLVNGAVAGGLYGAQREGYISPEHAAETGAALLANRGLLKLLSSRALATGEGRTINGLARLLKPAPRYLPASVNGLMLTAPEDPNGP